MSKQPTSMIFFILFLVYHKKLRLNSNNLFEALKTVKYTLILPCEKKF